MARASQLRNETLSKDEQAEPTRLIAVRIPASWHKLLQTSGSITDKLLKPLADEVRRLKLTKVEPS